MAKATPPATPTRQDASQETERDAEAVQYERAAVHATFSAEGLVAMREKLQELVDRWHAQGIPSILWVLEELKRILATEPPAVRVKAGWVAKCGFGLSWFPEKPHWHKDTWVCSGRIEFLDDVIEHVITDPWPDKPNGGPECLLEVKL